MYRSTVALRNARTEAQSHNFGTAVPLGASTILRDHCEMSKPQNEYCMSCVVCSILCVAYVAFGSLYNTRATRIATSFEQAEPYSERVGYAFGISESGTASERGGAHNCHGNLASFECAP